MKMISLALALTLISSASHGAGAVAAGIDLYKINEPILSYWAGKCPNEINSLFARTGHDLYSPPPKLSTKMSSAKVAYNNLPSRMAFIAAEGRQLKTQSLLSALNKSEWERIKTAGILKQFIGDETNSANAIDQKYWIAIHSYFTGTRLSNTEMSKIDLSEMTAFLQKKVSELKAQTAPLQQAVEADPQAQALLAQINSEPKQPEWPPHAKTLLSINSTGFHYPGEYPLTIVSNNLADFKYQIYMGQNREGIEVTANATLSADCKPRVQITTHDTIKNTKLETGYESKYCKTSQWYSQPQLKQICHAIYGIDVPEYNFEGDDTSVPPAVK